MPRSPVLVDPVTVPTRPGTTSHWLARLAAEAGLPHAHLLEIDARTPTPEAWRTIVAQCGIDDAVLCDLVARRHSLPPVRWTETDPHVARLLPEKTARRHLVVPLREDYRTLWVATSDPRNLEAEQDIAFATARGVKFEVASPQQIQLALDASYANGPAPTVASALSRVRADLADAIQVVKTATPDRQGAELDSDPVINLANLVLRDALEARASDVHLEPTRDQGVVRFRVDGLMREYLRVPLAVHARVVSRIKVLGGMDIADRLRPQDGRSRLTIHGQTVDLRISTVPTRESEKAVIRLLDPTATRRLESLELPPAELERIRRLLGYREGMWVVTGPTGSGKTTTLYAALSELAQGTSNVVTIEDPVEYELAGVTQIQVETKREVTFASSLRAVLRQDPDVIFVGEIRDRETAEIAAHAALTGHLVLTTLHTNDSASAVTRLLDLGLEPATIASMLRGVLAQRLVRKLCDGCAVRIVGELTPEEQRLANVTGVRPLRRPVGCDFCAGTGFYGRVAVPEVLLMSPGLEKLVANRATAAAINRAAEAEGLRTLLRVALDYVARGVTTFDEVQRAIGDVVPPADAASGPPRVLVVDDDASMRLVEGALLRSLGVEVVEAADGAQAMEQLEGPGDWALVLLDLQMPQLDGDEVLRRMRASSRHAATPVIIFTGHPDPSLEVTMIEAGADDYLRKPLDPARFTARCKSVLRRAA